jgi:hypothetical protein
MKTMTDDKKGLTDEGRKVYEEKRADGKAVAQDGLPVIFGDLLRLVAKDEMTMTDVTDLLSYGEAMKQFCDAYAQAAAALDHDTRIIFADARDLQGIDPETVMSMLSSLIEDEDHGVPDDPDPHPARTAMRLGPIVPRMGPGMD